MMFMSLVVDGSAMMTYVMQMTSDVNGSMMPLGLVMNVNIR